MSTATTGFMSDPVQKSNSPFTIPDDAEQSTYRWIIVAAKRARQLQGGARPFLPTTSKKATVIAGEEVRRGLVKWEDPANAPAAEEPEAPPEE